MDFDVNEPIDCFFKCLSPLKDKKLFLFDLDGTIYEEDNVFDGAFELLEEIDRMGGQYVFITNNSSKSVTDYVRKVNYLGIKANKDNFFTSTQATILFLKENYEGKKVYCQGTKSFIRELKTANISITEEVEEDVDLVLVGFDMELTSEKLRKTCILLQTKNIPFIATNPDVRCPVNFGYIPDCGSICSMLESTTGKTPYYIGKPDAAMVNYAIEKNGFTKEETVVIGDRLYTDITSGENAGVTTICVLTGETQKEDIINGKIHPTYTLRSIWNLWKALEYYHK